MVDTKSVLLFALLAAASSIIEAQSPTYQPSPAPTPESTGTWTTEDTVITVVVSLGVFGLIVGFMLYSLYAPQIHGANFNYQPVPTAEATTASPVHA